MIIQQACCIEHAIDHGPSGTPAAGIKHPNWNDLHFPHNPSHTHAIIRNRANSTGDVAAMSMVIFDVRDVFADHKAHA